ncbi:hypothetical protein DN752_08420 [Echinicola strongylocentroti]|uniref:DUF202 domain-containing protein n=1 Tax=Echinicola strongylocentroti TaxID=1795355 RepID=A0A2Z4IGA9_9BACT|nr:hypothetical protein [Echinicola strongylocentroti]AWW30142.1 hypothetical protein DN752_08420 [Echinicola strongylocentroti]
MKTKEEENQWKEYRLSILEQKSKSEDDFEKYITYISSGALGLTVTFIDKISPLKESVYVWIIILGWGLFALTLFLNLFSHYLSSRYNEKTINEIDMDIDYSMLLENIDKRNEKISCLNISSIISLGTGILFVLIFSSLNAYYNG